MNCIFGGKDFRLLFFDCFGLWNSFEYDKVYELCVKFSKYFMLLYFVFIVQVYKWCNDLFV